MVAACAAAGFDLVIVETPGIGQGDAAVTEVADVSLYVMTPEYGAASQLEKIDMLELADVVAINKFDRRGADDAFRQVCRQWGRDHRAGGRRPEPEPVFGTIASRFNDDGVTALYHRLKAELIAKGLAATEGVLPRVAGPPVDPDVAPSSHRNRHRYLAEIAETGPGYHATTDRLVAEARRSEQVAAVVAEAQRPASTPATWRPLAAQPGGGAATPRAGGCSRSGTDSVPRSPSTARSADEPDGPVDDAGARLWRTSLSGTRVPRVALPRVTDHGELVRWLRAEHLPGSLPLHRRGLSRSSATARTRPGCSPARATRSGPTGASTCWPRASRPPGCRRPSTR